MPHRRSTSLASLERSTHSLTHSLTHDGSDDQISSTCVEVMSSLATTARPARRLLSLAGRGVINTGRRGYAKPLRLQPARRGSSPPKPPPPSPSYRIQRRPPPGSATNQGPPRLLFSEEHVPQAPQWEEALRNLENEHLTVKECIDGAHRYVAVATQYDTQWIETLESGMCSRMVPQISHQERS